MKSDMEIKVTLNIGLTPELESLAKTLADSLGRGGFAGQCGCADCSERIPVAPPCDCSEREEPEPEQAPEQAPEPVAETQPAEPKITNELMRTAMEAALRKWAGPDYQDSTDPKTIAIRKSLMRVFRQITMACSKEANKPSELEGYETRRKFIQEIEKISLDPKTGLCEWLPF